MDKDELNMDILINIMVILLTAIMISIIIFLVKDEIDFHNSHYTQESEIIVTIDKKETESIMAWEGAGIFDNCGSAIIPCNIKVLNKEDTQKYCDDLQETINKMDDDKINERKIDNDI